MFSRSRSDNVFPSLNENHQGISSHSLSISIPSQSCSPQARQAKRFSHQRHRALSACAFAPAEPIGVWPIIGAGHRNLFSRRPGSSQTGRFSPARSKNSRKVLALDPSLVEAEVNLGLAYQSLLDYDAAARHLTDALRERPNLPGINVIVGMDYLKLGSPEKAAPYLRACIGSSILQAVMRMKPWRLYHLTQENFHGAAEQYRKVADLNSDKPEALFTHWTPISGSGGAPGVSGRSSVSRVRVGASIPRRYAIRTQSLGRCRTGIQESPRHRTSAIWDCIRRSAKPICIPENWRTQKQNFATSFSLIRGMSGPGLGLATFNWPKGKRWRPLPRWPQSGKTLPNSLKSHAEFPSIELTRENGTGRHIALAGSA